MIGALQQMSGVNRHPWETNHLPVAKRLLECPDALDGMDTTGNHDTLSLTNQKRLYALLPLFRVEDSGLQHMGNKPLRLDYLTAMVFGNHFR